MLGLDVSAMLELEGPGLDEGVKFNEAVASWLELPDAVRVPATEGVAEMEPPSDGDDVVEGDSDAVALGVCEPDMPDDAAWLGELVCAALGA